MKKQELIHVHSLLGEVANYCLENEVPVALEEYDQLGTKPSSIHLRKAEHKDAVFALTDAINAAVDAESVESVTPEPVRAD